MKTEQYYYQVNDRCLLLNWLILTLDETVEPPLPLQRRWHLLNWTQLNSTEIQFICSHFDFDCKSSLHEHGAPKSSLKDAPMYQFSNERRNDEVMLRFRKHFDFVTEEQFKLAHDNPPCIGINFDGVTLPDYSEDMSGQSINHHEIFQRVNGPGTILLGDLSSILTVGPAPIKGKNMWSLDDSNLIAHFFSVIEQIGASRWVTSTSQYTKSEGKVVNSTLPRLHEFRSILILFRQLYEAKPRTDDLLRTAANRYMDAINSDLKKLWIQNEIDQFDSVLSTEPMGMHGHGFCGLEFLEAFGYGYRLFHATPRLDGVEKLESLVKRYSPEEVMFAVDSTLRHLYNHASKVYNVIRFDLSHWNEDDCPKSTVLDLRDILGD